RTKFRSACFHGKKLPGQAQGGLSRDSERFLRETAPGGHFLAAVLFSRQRESFSLQGRFPR
ncbi:MAG: hypothetical protein ACLUS6_07770, partial [Dysosmobacter sp.]